MFTLKTRMATCSEARITAKTFVERRKEPNQKINEMPSRRHNKNCTKTHETATRVSCIVDSSDAQNTHNRGRDTLDIANDCVVCVCVCVQISNVDTGRLKSNRLLNDDNGTLKNAIWFDGEKMHDDDTWIFYGRCQSTDSVRVATSFARRALFIQLCIALPEPMHYKEIIIWLEVNTFLS